MSRYITPADLLVSGLALVSLPNLPEPLPPEAGGVCAITGQPIAVGYPAREMTTTATSEFADCFNGRYNVGYISEAAARCFKNASPRKGNPTARTVMVFADGTYYNPMIARGSARKKERACWSELVRDVWPARAGEQVLIILTTDMKRRLWPYTRVGSLGANTVLYYFDNATHYNGLLWVDWPRLIDCLDLVEDVYSVGFPKEAIREGLFSSHKATRELGLADTSDLEVCLREYRGGPEFMVATLIAQKREL